MDRKKNWKSELILRGRQDPAWWIESVLGDSLWNRQKDICQSVVEHERTAVVASFGVGKTMLAARLAIWFLCCFKPSKVVTTAPTLRQVKDLLWSELRNAHKKAIIPIGGELLQLSLKFDEDHFCVGFSTDAENMDKFTGLHQSNLLVIFDYAY